MTLLAELLSSRSDRSLDAVAKKAGLSPQRVREVAAGNRASLGEVRDIAKALRLPMSALLDEQESGSEPIKVLFRKTLAQRTRTQSAPSVVAVSSQIRGATEIARDARLPTNSGWLDLFRGMLASTDEAERFAALFRKVYGQLDESEPFLHLPRVLAEELGVFVLFNQDASVEGVSAIVDQYAFILLAARSFAPRMLFTLAHELGHLLAHHDARVSGYAMLDFEGDIGSGRVNRRDEERFADAFASAVLLPRQGVLKALQEFRSQLGLKGELGDVEILTLARFFGVSFEVAARRCEQLKLLPPRGAQALYQQLTAEHGTPERRANEIGLPSRDEIDIVVTPALIAGAARLVREGDLSMGQAVDTLNLPVSALVVANAGIPE